jgi:peptidoglycan/LPS O-acetylase OafA/YrhL
MRNGAKREPGLDLLRAIAIGWVLLYHSMTQGIGHPLRPIGDFGWMGVDLFFVLSGYLIGSQLLKGYVRGEQPEIGQFYARRAFRILPAYFVVVACYFLFPSAREAPGLQPAWQFLTFTQNLLLDYQHNHAFSHAWSLCVEEHFYLFVPLLVVLLMRRPSWKRTALLCGAILLGGIGIRWFMWKYGLNNGGLIADHPWLYVELIYSPTYARLDGLLAGVVLAAIRWFRPGIWSKAMENPYKLLCAGAVGMAGAIWLAMDRRSFGASVFGFPLTALSMALMVTAAVSPRGVLGRWRVPGAQAIATITFSLYLSHKMTWHLVRTHFPSLVAHGGYHAYAVYGAAALAVGTALYFLVERPFLLLRNRLDRQPRPVVRSRPANIESVWVEEPAN